MSVEVGSSIRRLFKKKSGGSNQFCEVKVMRSCQIQKAGPTRFLDGLLVVC